MMFQSRALMLLAILAATSVDALSRSEKKAYRKAARAALRRCPERKGKKIRFSLDHAETACGEGNFDESLLVITMQDRATDDALGVAQFDCDGNMSYFTCGEPCEDGDCGEDGFCRPTEVDGYSTCTPYSDFGEWCGGFTMASQQSRCNPNEAICFVPITDPVIADRPGTCEEPCSGKTLDCTDPNQWCRTVDSSVETQQFICTDFASTGESCGGYTLPEWLSRCDSDIDDCVNQEPGLADNSGRCTRRCDDESGCGSEEFCNEGHCRPGCDLNAGEDSCGRQFWCRPLTATESNAGVCTLFVGANSVCDNTEDPSTEQRCAEIFTCETVARKDGAANPGICGYGLD